MKNPSCPFLVTMNYSTLSGARVADQQFGLAPTTGINHTLSIQLCPQPNPPLEAILSSPPLKTFVS